MSINKAIQRLLNAKENGSPETLVVHISQLKGLLWLMCLCVAASSVITFTLTGQKQVDTLRSDFAASCSRYDKKLYAHDEALALLQQQLGQINQNVQRLLDIQLGQGGRK